MPGLLLIAKENVDHRYTRRRNKPRKEDSEGVVIKYVMVKLTTPPPPPPQKKIKKIDVCLGSSAWVEIEAPKHGLRC